MKTQLTLLIITLFTSCSIPLPVHSKKYKAKHRARITFYHGHEDKWGSRTASGKRAKEGVTVAAAKNIPFNTPIVIPALLPLIGHEEFVVEDRGSAVTSMKASHGKTPVFDVFVSSLKKMQWLKKIAPEYMEVSL